MPIQGPGSNRDPERERATPATLAASPDLSDRDKLEILRSWKLDLVALLQATSENMGSANVEAGDNSEKLRSIAKAIDALERRLGTETSGRTGTAPLEN